jgi:ethanolamine utilization microcompartment shell protein EutL
LLDLFQLDIGMSDAKLPSVHVADSISHFLQSSISGQLGNDLEPLLSHGHEVDWGVDTILDMAEVTVATIEPKLDRRKYTGTITLTLDSLG